MFYRELGNTGVMVSEIGMGGNRLGQSYASDEHWVNLVHRAVDLGVNLFDTSETYGWGDSEEVLGKALGNRDDVLIATKMGRIRETDEHDFSAERMMETAEGSLRRLQRDVIDIYQLHSPNRAALERETWAEGMEQLKRQGKIRFSAVAVQTEDDAVWLMRQGLVDVLQITYNIFHTAPEAQLFEVARQTGTGLMGRMPLARGVLTGKFHPGGEVESGHRALLDGDRMWENIERAEDLRPVAETYEGGMTRMALHFSLTPNAMSAIIPGARTTEQLEENVRASNGQGLPDEVRAAIRVISAKWD